MGSVTRIVLLRAFVGALLAVTFSVRAAPTLSYRVVAEYPHDSTAFTEGLAIDHGLLFESTGRYGRSMILVRDLASGRLLRSVALDATDFGEGLTVVRDAVVQLTWRNGHGYRYDRQLRRTGRFRIDSEGWGLAYDGRQLIRSDGSSRLQMLDAERFEPVGELEVHDGAIPVEQINELEFARGLIFANIWLTDRVAVISPKSGQVVAWLDLSALRQRFDRPLDWNESENVLNGIAFDHRSGHYFVTGKCWPVMFELAIATPLR